MSLEMTIAKIRAIAEGERRLKNQLALIISAQMLRAGILEVSFTEREMEEVTGYRLDWAKDPETKAVSAKMTPKGGTPT